MGTVKLGAVTRRWQRGRGRGMSIALFVATTTLVGGCAIASAGVAARDVPEIPAGSAAAAIFRDPAVAYIELARPMNARLHAVGARIDASIGIDEMRSISMDYARIHREFAAELGRIAFPAAVRPLVGDAIAAVKSVGDLNERLAVATPNSIVPLGAELGRALDHQRATLAALRAALHIGPLPGEDE